MLPRCALTLEKGNNVVEINSLHVRLSDPSNGVSIISSIDESLGACMKFNINNGKMLYMNEGTLN